MSSKDPEKTPQSINLLDQDEGEQSSLSTDSNYSYNFFKSQKGDLSKFDTSDVALRAKINLINNALDEIGFTWYHFKLFCLNGMGYAVDSQLTLIQGSVQTYVRYQYRQPYPSDTHALYAGLLVGAVFWGFGADLIGRKIAFNSSLLISAIFAILTGVMGNYGTYCLFLGLSAAASGGNLVLDTTVFLEFLPSKDQWLVTLMASWWSIGQVVAVLITWGFFSQDKYVCSGYDDCPEAKNMGWRYVWIVNGAIVLIIAILRLTVIKLEETPKFLVCNRRDEEAVECLQRIAAKYNKPCSLTIEDLKACGEITSNENFLENSSLKSTYRLTVKHLKSLFANRIMTISSTLIAVSWALLGIAYPLYTNFLPIYLATRGAETSASTVGGVYRDSVISNVASTAGGLIGGGLLYFFPSIGRKGVMVFGGVSSMALFFGYTAVRTRAQNVGLSSAVYTSIFIYYSCLYAYTPEVMPSASRGTGNALCVALTRFTGCFVPLIAYFANTSSALPVWICGACVGVIGICALFFPFEPSKQRVA
ncbi:hypothetical protein WICANDRAFT_61639 [Wickerhamomyces anomalus NRRL Y-366-8]|uniref:Major facilitator superfamily (MFS) profile domain-containing protein n=1 Tax=Wickerhamomyces anomalus (strain ATCC 58044 / CBS 1984 / NCYC 433 / NRRL Y-366-8) TaxID=683960 RepID=A0A1E3P6U0_WICAA|nr:uncharacterized protein WICANDRAFT_61639 [Wickerhamomyces anomalus NRRL Y-366-8]ODQ61073.1 hypothetical protein WICANDRAFT_61639 [Wickerhamomyces anomalus NRRL Y-366-8]